MGKETMRQKVTLLLDPLLLRPQGHERDDTHVVLKERRLMNLSRA